ncbi:aminotransferase class III-fold pyridoxal phosphate-dependent enzyme [Salipiger sp. P9]|uniref:aminotransferase class III-fold pyridoxal phosphate-dependent enzyme n=1 Tax=Salipiger pentaromativorans TaxID=2943193 RepID=UPI0021572756|nr:aminotransferase class III-fold pyridoxal phosphate-dependent enzyme [Salipiger pentaromativorans]MCR8548157.1 aminotransferase class III-fold pyridoxal phosphate-dependent enzyme [Salipiger pentaromativorans]
MDYKISNSLVDMDVASMLHPQTNARVHLEKGPIIISGAEGTRIFDEAGRDFIDCISGMWCCPLGFKSERLAKVAYDQMSALGYYHLYKHHSHEPAIRLADKIMETAPSFMSRVIFQNSGTEANEAALKLCWYYQHAVGRPERTKVIGRKGGFHGQSTAMSSLSGRSDYQVGFGLPMSDRFLLTEMPHYYRNHEAGETEEQFSDRMAAALEELILREGPETIAAMFAEPIMGAGGGLMPPEGYFAKIQAVLRKYDILFVADEVITGVGRTGNWWATQSFDLQPDIITSAKGLGSGLVPIGAAIVGPRIFDAVLTMSDRLGNYSQGSTFGGNPVCTAVALETLTIIEEEGLIAHGSALGDFFHSHVTGDNSHPMLADVRKMGAMVSMELMADQETRKPFDPSVNIMGLIGKHCKEHGVAVRLNSNRLVFAPALNMSMADAEQAAERFHRGIAAAWDEARSI